MRFKFIGLAAATASVLMVSATGALAQFTQGNLVVSRVGNGSTALTSLGTAAFLDQFTTTGTFVNSTALPTTVSGNNRRVVNSGTAASEGFLSRSSDGQYLLYGGYDAALGAGSSSATGGNVGVGTGFTASIANTTAASANRVVARIDSSGVVDSSTALTDAFSGNNIRSVAGTNGTNFFVSGTSQGTPTTGGVRTTTLGSTTSVAAETAQNNVRVVNLFNGQLFYSTGAGTTGIYSVANDGTTSLVAASASPYDFAINAAGTVLYVADDSATVGGIRRYNGSNGTFTFAYSLTNTAVRGLTVDFSGPNAVVYATTTETSANRVITGTDNTGSLTAFTTLVTAGNNTAFRDVVFSPIGITANTPEPGTLALLGVGAAPFAARFLRRRAKKAHTA